MEAVENADEPLALGADAVLRGRPHANGSAAGGEAGVLNVLANFLAAFDLTTGLSGRDSVADISPAAVPHERDRR